MRPHNFHLLAALILLVAAFVLAFYAPMVAVFTLLGAVVAANHWKASKNRIIDT